MGASFGREGVSEGEDQDPDTEDEGKREQNDHESIRGGEGMSEDEGNKEEQKGGGGDEEVDITIGADDGLGLPGEDVIQRKSRGGGSKPACGLQTRGSKRKAELEGVRTTRSKVPKLNVHVKQPVYRRRKGRYL
jgi:hypothetical protein